MAGAAAGTRERQATPPEEASSSLSEEDYSALLLGGVGGQGDDELEDEAEEDLEGADDEAEDGEEDEGDEDDGAGASEEDDDAEEPEPGAQGTPAADRVDPDVEKWAQQLGAKPGSLMQVPTNRRKAVITRFGQLQHAAGQQSLKAAAVQAIEVARQQAFDEGYRQAQAALTEDADYEEVKALAETDMEAFGQMAHDEPEKVQRYLQRRDREKNPGREDAVNALREAAEAVLEPIKGNQAALGKLQAKEAADPNRYRGAKGLANLTADVATVLAETQAETARKAREPEAKAAAARMNGARHREALPKVSGGTGRAGGGAGEARVSADYTDYLATGFAAARKRK